MTSEETEIVTQIEAERDSAYRQRGELSALVARMTLANGGKAGIATDHLQDPEWQRMLYIDLPHGQVSFHFHKRDWDLLAGLPIYTGTWDGSNGDDRARRITRAYQSAVPADSVNLGR